MQARQCTRTRTGWLCEAQFLAVRVFERRGLVEAWPTAPDTVLKLGLCGAQGAQGAAPGPSSAAAASGAGAGPRLGKLGKDPAVPTDFLPDADRERAEARLREQLKREYELRQQARAAGSGRVGLPCPRQAWLRGWGACASEQLKQTSRAAAPGSAPSSPVLAAAGSVTHTREPAACPAPDGWQRLSPGMFRVKRKVFCMT